jgi:hypothetical protein
LTGLDASRLWIAAKAAQTSTIRFVLPPLNRNSFWKVKTVPIVPFHPGASQALLQENLQQEQNTAQMIEQSAPKLMQKTMQTG